MAHNWKTTKEGGVGLTSKIVQSGSGTFPLMYAKDLDWAGVNVDDDTVLNTTDDLLDYISGVSKKAVHEEVSITTYKIYDAATNASFETVQYNKYQPITLNIVRAINGGESNLSIGEQFDDHKKQLLDFNGNLLSEIYLEDKDNIVDENDKIKAGLSAGIKTISIKSTDGDYVLASFVLTIIPQVDKAYMFDFYTATTTEDAPAKPENAKKKNGVWTKPTGWKFMEEMTDEIADKNKFIWMSNVLMEGSDNDMYQKSATDPIRFIREIDIVNDYKETTSFAATVFRAAKKGTTPSWAGTAPTGGSFNYTTKTLTPPTDWKKSMSEAVTAYGGNDCEVYVSYNNYVAYKESNGTYTESHQTGWTTPIKYFDIDNIIKEAKEAGKVSANAAIARATDDLQNAKNLLQESSEQCAAIINQLNSDYSWTLLSATTVNNPKYSLIETSDPLYSAFGATGGTLAIASEDDFNNNSSLTTDAYKDKYVLVNSYAAGTTEARTNCYVGYVPTSMSLVTQLASMDERVQELKTTVDEKTDDYIRLQASKGFLSSVTWTTVDASEWNTICSANPDNGILVNTLPTVKKDASHANGYEYGKYYKIISAEKYYRCDYPISTGFLNILSDNVNLGVAQTLNGNRIASQISLSVDGGQSQAVVDADTIVLTGTTIAAAIAAGELNVANKCYIKPTGQVLLAQGTSGACSFNTDGSLSLAGGQIQYAKNSDNVYELSVSGTINAQGGRIGTGSDYWVISGNKMIGKKSNNDQIQLSPTYVGCLSNGGTRWGWRLDRSGGGLLANGNITWSGTGECKIGTNDSYIDVSSQGVTLHGAGGEIALSNESITSISTNETIINSLNTSVVGTLNTQDLTIGGTSRFNADGSGQVAGGKIRWDQSGNTKFVGDIEATNFKTISEDGSTTLEITTVGKANLGSAILEQAGLVDYNDYTPIMIIHDRNSEGEEVGKYIVSLTKIGGTSTEKVTSYILSNVSSTPRYQDFIENRPGTESVLRTTYKTNGVITSTEVKPTGTYFKRGSNYSMLVSCTNNSYYYVMTEAIEIIRYDVDAEGNVATSHTFMVKGAEYDPQHNSYIYSSWFIPKLGTDGDFVYDTDTEGRWVAVGGPYVNDNTSYAKFENKLTSGTKALGWQSQGSVIRIYDSYNSWASDPKQAAYTDMNHSLVYYNGSGNGPWVHANY